MKNVTTNPLFQTDLMGAHVKITEEPEISGVVRAIYIDDCGNLMLVFRQEVTGTLYVADVSSVSVIL